MISPPQTNHSAASRKRGTDTFTARVDYPEYPSDPKTADSDVPGPASNPQSASAQVDKEETKPPVSEKTMMANAPQSSYQSASTSEKLVAEVRRSPNYH